MYFTTNDGDQNFLVFAPKLSSLILHRNKKLLTAYRLKYHLKKTKSFDNNLELTMRNIANDRVILKFNTNLAKKDL